jgi:hypothetical protein
VLILDRHDSFANVILWGKTRFPLMMVIDYRGFRLLAASLLPITKSSVLHGSFDAGKTLYCDPGASPIVTRTLKQLNLKVGCARVRLLSGCHQGISIAFSRQEHIVTTASGDASGVICGPIDMEVHRSPVDGRLYGLDLARLYPPEPPLLRASEGLLAYSVRLLRPELVAASPVPLSSDAFSGFGRINHVRVASFLSWRPFLAFDQRFCVWGDAQEIHNAEVAAMFNEIGCSIIPQLAHELNSQCASNGSASAAVPHVPPNAHVLACGCAVNSDDGVSRMVCWQTAPPKPQLGDVDYLGPLVPCDMSWLNPTSYDERKAKENPLSKQEEPLAEWTWSRVPYDEDFVIRIAHSRGINMRHCGKLLQSLTCQLWRRRVLIELVARCMKVCPTLCAWCCTRVCPTPLNKLQTFLRQASREEMERVKLATSEPYRILLLKTVCGL